MTPAGWVVLIGLGIICLSLVAFLVILNRRLAGVVGELTTPLPAPLVETREPEPWASEPRVIDPNDPPRYMHYRPRSYDPTRAPRCTCHRRVIEYDEKVLLWPIPGHPEGGMDLLCEATYTEPGGRQ